MSFAVLGYVLAFVFILLAILAASFLQRRSASPRSRALWYSDGVGAGSSSDASCSPGSDGGGCGGD